MTLTFFTASSLVGRLRRARDEGRLDRELAAVGKAEMVVVDELGFLPLDADGARLLFQVVSDAYERQSVVFTTNLEFSMWGAVFGDDQMAAAVIDRKCEASHFRSNAKFHIMRSWADGTAV